MSEINSRSEQAIFTKLSDIEGYEATALTQRFPWETSYDLIMQSAIKYGDDDALAFLNTAEKNETPVTVSFKQLAVKVNQTANVLYDLGVRDCDAVAVLLPNLLETHFALWGSQAAGIANPINPLLELEHTTHIMQATQVKVLITLGPDQSPQLWAKTQSLIKEVPSLSAVLVVGDSSALPNTVSTSTSVQILNFSVELDKQNGAALTSIRKITGDQMAAYFHTGGTTGRPKIACITHANIAFISQLHADRSAYQGRMTTLSALPLFHIFGTIVAGIATLFSGRKIVVMTAAGFRNPNVLKNWWHHVARFQARGFAAVPTILAALLQVPVGDEDISCLDEVACGAAPLPQGLQLAFQEKINVLIINGYGMTESTCLITRPAIESGSAVGHVGMRYPYMEMKIAQINGTELLRTCEQDEVGVVLLRGPHVFAGYLNPQDNSKAWVDRTWFNTGDRGFINKDGNLTLTGRAKDLIIRGGHNIDPLLIEEPLSKHSAVAGAVAVGQPDPYAGEVPVAFVTLIPGQQVDVETLLEYCQQTISERAAIPKRIEIIEAFPLTAVAKVYKSELRNRAAQFAVQHTLAKAGIKSTVVAGMDPKQGQVAHITLQHASQKADAEANLSGFALTLDFPA